ncbi:MAG: hypothetical protein R2764_15470 [Bacteroidales bacterium]
MDGKQVQKSISAPSLSGTVPVVVEYLILFGIGIIAIMLHARLRTPLNIPGHHGLEFMALLLAGRVASNIKWASSVSSLGIGLVLLFPAFGFTDPFMGINFMFPGIMIDLLYNIRRQHKWHFFELALIAGVAYMAIPVSRMIIHLLTAYPYSSFIKHGYLIPMIFHFLSGMVGGFVGAGLTSSVIKKFIKK